MEKANLASLAYLDNVIYNDGELFSNLSFFGKYVKKHFGMSPKAYREQALRKAQ